MRAMFQTYRALMRAGILAEFQYPIAQYFYMIGMITEPVVYLVVWGIVAQAQGGQVGGIHQLSLLLITSFGCWCAR
jgi:ABC-2 type transport system permease protein